jgi:hypothetical protein
MIAVCSTYGGEEKCMQDFGGEIWRKDMNLEDPGVDRRKI